MSYSPRQRFNRRSLRRRYKLRAVNKSGRLRLSVHRSNSHFYAQLIDDSLGQTVASVSTVDAEFAKKGLKNNKETAAVLGAALAKRAKAVKVSDVYFDCGGLRYHGKIAAFAEAARTEGLNF